jgi:hypothetical protein
MLPIPDEFLKCVAFLCALDGDGRTIPRATTFLVSVPLEGHERGHVGYFVTARHCIYAARAEGHNAFSFG